MQNTYTYTARSRENPEKIVTFTLHGTSLSVDMAAPVEQAENIIATMQADIDGYDKFRALPWLKPITLSLLERGTKPFRIADVKARLNEDALTMRTWIRLGGFRLAPLTLMHERIDNVDAARAFVEEVKHRKKAHSGALSFLNIFDYWGTWIGAILSFVAFFAFWRKRSEENGTA